MPGISGGIVALAIVGVLATATPAAVEAPVLGRSFIVARVRGTVLVRPRGTRAFVVLNGPTSLPVGSEIDTTRGTMSVTEASDFGGAVNVADIQGGRVIVTQRRALHAPATFTLSLPLHCPAIARATPARSSSGQSHRPRKRHLNVSESGGSWDTRGQYVATGAVGTEWTTTDTCSTSAVSVQSGAVRVRNLITHKTVTLRAGQHLTVNAAVLRSYTCAGTEKLLFNNWNTRGVTGGGAPPTFSTGGKPYCLVQLATYHYNNGLGSTPGTIELTSGAGNIGPLKATGQSASGGPGDINWLATPPSSAGPVILDGSYTCRDSDPKTWAQNSQSGGKGFCRVTVEPALAG